MVSENSSFASLAQNPHVGRKAFFSPVLLQPHRTGTGTPGHSSLPTVTCSVPPVGKMPWTEQMPTTGWGGTDSRALSLMVRPSTRPGVALTRKSSALVSPQPQNRLRVWAPDSPGRHQAGSKWISTSPALQNPEQPSCFCLALLSGVGCHTGHPGVLWSRDAIVVIWATGDYGASPLPHPVTWGGCSCFRLPLETEVQGAQGRDMGVPRSPSLFASLWKLLSPPTKLGQESKPRDLWA